MRLEEILEVFCRKCGANMPEDSQFCVRCGLAVIVPSVIGAAPGGTANGVATALEPDALERASGQPIGSLSSPASTTMPCSQSIIKTFTWQGLGLTLCLAVAAISGLIGALTKGDWAGGLGTLLLPLIFWGAFNWQHYWRKEPKPMTWADNVLGVIGWMGAVGMMGLVKH
jgi:hypothetical protein